MDKAGGVAHRLEQAAHNHLVVGSIPTAPTRINSTMSQASRYDFIFYPCYMHGFFIMHRYYSYKDYAILQI